jgi:hypothetical protein
LSKKTCIRFRVRVFTEIVVIDVVSVTNSGRHCAKLVEM